MCNFLWENFVSFPGVLGKMRNCSGLLIKVGGVRKNSVRVSFGEWWGGGGGGGQDEPPLSKSLRTELMTRILYKSNSYSSAEPLQTIYLK